MSFDHHNNLNALTAWQYEMHDSGLSWMHGSYGCMRVLAVLTVWLYESLDCITILITQQSSLHYSLHCMTVFIAWQSWLYDSPTAWQLDCTDRLISLTERLPWQADALVAWLPWQLVYPDRYIPFFLDLDSLNIYQYSLTIINAWMPWQHDSITCIIVGLSQKYDYP